MAKQNRKMEGSDEQRRAAARDAKAQGKRPSEVGATQGASKQRKEVSKQASHQDRVETTREGKVRPGPQDTARPGNRDRDPKREGDWT